MTERVELRFIYDPVFDVMIVRHDDEEHMITKPLPQIPLQIVWSDGETTELSPVVLAQLFATVARRNKRGTNACVQP